MSKATLHQKSLLDNFLMDSIEYCRTMAGIENNEPLRPTSNFHNMQKTQIRDLNWEDKEKLLRVLYSKITLGVSPGYWKQIEAQKKKTTSYRS